MGTTALQKATRRIATTSTQHTCRGSAKRGNHPTRPCPFFWFPFPSSLSSQLERQLVVEPRVWSERQRAYKDASGDKGDLMCRGWRCATTEEVRERSREVVDFLENKTLNIFKMSKCQGLSVPQAKLQDGVILPKIQYQTENDIEVVSTQDPEFKTFENL